MKNGIILTGGNGTRLGKLTSSINKHLLTINNRFLIDYPLDTLKVLGVENLTVILGGTHFQQIVQYLKDGADQYMKINYIYQREPKGIAQAISLCERFVNDKDEFVVLLGDNVYGENLSSIKVKDKAKIILTKHEELQRLGVASIKKNKIVKIEEKPQVLDSKYKNYAITGCYFFDHQFFDYYQKIRPSARSEFEICDIIKLYNLDDKLTYDIIEDYWIDAGTHSAIRKLNGLVNGIT